MSELGGRDNAFLDDLFEFLRIPSVSADAAHVSDVRRAGEWICKLVHRAGGDAELIDWQGRPLALGEIKASSRRASVPTVLVYGHFDVQPPGPLEQWVSPPFEPNVRQGWLYARGVADDKAQLYMLLKAAELLASEGALPVDVRVVCDGEEEIFGMSIVDFLAQDERGADVCVIFDAPMLRRGVPIFIIGTRGLAYFHVCVRTGSQEAHSGYVGGAAMNAIHALIETLSGVLSRGDRLPAPLRAGVSPPSDDDLAVWAELQPGLELLEEHGLFPADDRAAEEFYVRTYTEPAVDVHGVAGGSPFLQQTVLPVQADANLSVRIAPTQDTERIALGVERLLRESAPGGALVEVERLALTPPGRLRAEASAVQLGLDVFNRVLGVRPLLLPSGATLPVISALAAKGIPTILTGFNLPEGNIHAANERLLAEYVPLGINAARELYGAFANLSKD